MEPTNPHFDPNAHCAKEKTCEVMVTKCDKTSRCVSAQVLLILSAKPKAALGTRSLKPRCNRTQRIRVCVLHCAVIPQLPAKGTLWKGDIW